MPIEAVVGDVGLSANKPFGKRQVPFQHLVPLLEPVKLRSDFRPIAFRVLRSTLRNAS